MPLPLAVIDTSVLVAALLSRSGALHQLLRRAGTGLFDIALSVPLVLEYEYVAKRMAPRASLTDSDVEDMIDYLCATGRHVEVFFLWRPFLRDPNDDMILEAAVTAGAECIITFNERDFAGAESLGIEVLSPGTFLQRIEAEECLPSV